MVSKISQYVMYVLMGISVIVTIMAFSGNYNAIIYTMYCFFFVSVILAFVLAGIGMITNPKGIKSSLMGLGGAAVLFGISYLLSDNEVLKIYSSGTTPSDSKLIGMGLIAMYLLFFGSIGTVVYAAISKMFK